ncbi:endonuclease V [Microbulbifer sp. OS29]|uniref:Endonuclease V n=1 Tax=Microbulbifer okhotskensis TaxID=2926617 RepID=A0A9X2ENS4_9GAMM|nr:endonuclease V [Microbulbifer okhotskensis]MCO1335096.1 endonuclease V [Microbulbifer okhotskensis]
MILVVDVDYREEGAAVAGVTFRNWNNSQPEAIYLSSLHTIADYEPGAFYKRELPCILTLIEEHAIKPSLIVIDGYVHLGADRKPGLGAHLYQALRQKIAIIGVAKKSFKDTPTGTEIFRGTSHKPLFVTSLGITQAEAKSLIVSMHGEHRVPTLLKQVDSVCRKASL